MQFVADHHEGCTASATARPDQSYTWQQACSTKGHKAPLVSTQHRTPWYGLFAGMVSRRARLNAPVGGLDDGGKSWELPLVYVATSSKHMSESLVCYNEYFMTEILTDR